MELGTLHKQPDNDYFAKPPAETLQVYRAHSIPQQQQQQQQQQHQSQQSIALESKNPLFKDLKIPPTTPASPIPQVQQPSSSSSNNSRRVRTSLFKPTDPTFNQSVGLTLPTNPQEWSITQVADWVSQNGGGRSGSDAVMHQKIDGMALMSLSAEDLFTVLRIETVGQRMQFVRGMEVLNAPPPTYFEEL
ncbi:hypothetical protein BDR26DRAFT_901292 [Obelidium mucronatum]|nr:hypothetical protein BDR26DRAFT_901292 [Obelidium mucronatum]